MIEGNLRQRLNVNFAYEDTDRAEILKLEYLGQGFSVISEYWPKGVPGDIHGYFILEMRAEFSNQKTAQR